MKRRETNNKLDMVQKPSLERPDTGTAVVKKTREQLLDQEIRTLCESTGTYSDAVGGRIIYQVANAQVWPPATEEDEPLINAIASIREMAPKNVVEAMLAVQMIASHEASLLFLRRATLDDQSTEGIDANVLRSTRLMRVFAQQVEAMQKLKGKAIQQTLTVEQVNVHQGGQAIVGSVNTSKKEGKAA
jgi:hypothetical protein